MRVSNESCQMLGQRKRISRCRFQSTYQSSALLLLGGASCQGIVAIVLIEIPALFSGHWNNNFHNKTGLVSFRTSEHVIFQSLETSKASTEQFQRKCTEKRLDLLFLVKKRKTIVRKVRPGGVHSKKTKSSLTKKKAFSFPLKASNFQFSKTK